LREKRDADDVPNLDSELWKRNRANTLYIRSTSAIKTHQPVPKSKMPENGARRYRAKKNNASKEAVGISKKNE
jgi:hypothetical protein